MNDSDQAGYIMGCGTPGTGAQTLTAIGLTASHAYAIMGVYEVFDEDGCSTKLIHMENP